MNDPFVKTQLIERKTDSGGSRNTPVVSKVRSELHQHAAGRAEARAGLKESRPAFRLKQQAAPLTDTEAALTDPEYYWILSCINLGHKQSLLTASRFSFNQEIQTNKNSTQRLALSSEERTIAHLQLKLIASTCRHTAVMWWWWAVWTWIYHQNGRAAHHIGEHIRLVTRDKTTPLKSKDNTKDGPYVLSTLCVCVWCVCMCVCARGGGGRCIHVSGRHLYPSWTNTANKASNTKKKEKKTERICIISLFSTSGFWLWNSDYLQAHH